jgi:hypothetical protein
VTGELDRGSAVPVNMRHTRDCRITRDDLAALHGGEAEFSRSAREFRSWAHLRLGCWCAPLPCHGDVLAEAAEAAAMR